MRTQTMRFAEAVKAIGEYLANISPETWDEAIWPRRERIFPNVGSPTLVVGYDANIDDPDRLRIDSTRVPPVLGFEVRVLHPYNPPRGEKDGLQYAQFACIEGEDVLQYEIREDPTLGGLVKETTIDASLAGPLEDEKGKEYWGHLITVTCDIY